MSKKKLSLDDRIGEMEERVGQLEKLFADHERERVKVRSELSECKADLKLVDESEAKKILSEIKKKLSDISEVAQIEILKTSVMSEVPRIFPSSLSRIAKAMDRPNDWWRKGESLTIEEWNERLTKEVGR